MVEICDHRQTADDLRNESIRTKILSLDILKKVILIYLLLVLCAETDYLSIESLSYPALDALECTTADEKDVLSVHMQELLLGVLASTLRRNIHDASFQELQHRLLHSLTGNITRDGRVVALAGNLVDLIDEDDSPLSLGNIEIRLLKEA